MAQNLPPTQASPVTPASVQAPVPPAPPPCPTCGRPLPPPFDPLTSGLLDWLLRIDEEIHHLKAAVETEALP